MNERPKPMQKAKRSILDRAMTSQDDISDRKDKEKMGYATVIRQHINAVLRAAGCTYKNSEMMRTPINIFNSNGSTQIISLEDSAEVYPETFKTTQKCLWFCA